ncbi:MAG: hypothetical protein PHH93_12470 [Prolixibacteraceae bacterium]|nr:hypothetical protein [Prolixibacteraceae bacterium]
MQYKKNHQTPKLFVIIRMEMERFKLAAWRCFGWNKHLATIRIQNLL